MQGSIYGGVMKHLKCWAMLRYPETRARLPAGSYKIENPSGVTVRYKKNGVAGEWRQKGREDILVMAQADDMTPPNGKTVLTFEQVLASLQDRKEGLSPLSGNARRKAPPDFLQSVWYLAGTLVAADQMHGGGWGCLWSNPPSSYRVGAQRFPCWIQLFDMAGREFVAHLAGKICAESIEGVSLNTCDSGAMAEALKAAGIAFSETEYLEARAMIDGQYESLRAVARDLIGQFKRPHGHPQGLKKYRLGWLIELTPWANDPNYAPVFDLPEGFVEGACVHSPGERYKEFGPLIYTPPPPRPWQGF